MREKIKLIDCRQKIYPCLKKLETNLHSSDIILPLSMVLETLLSYYRKLCSLVKIVNTIYQNQLLFSTAGCFIKIILCVYFSTFGHVVSTGSVNTQPLQTVLESAVWTTFYFCRIFSFTLAADSLSYEAKQVKHLVASLNNRFLDKESKEELMIFSNYVMSHEVEFAAYGFFTLNMRLLTSAIAAGTTYLVILVQFHSG
ncbi:gustatory receptor 68a-like isoform X2 [Nilaparvata lugens]|uniref:gustatory receptor 68a-like isoform X2 n=1 Tax=Nilaparvata lugens TaxID=108931 RepID=UPI00193DAFFD|nr:gustatory receptor 68a-like isoform X2 [Nilaparvata lugens]